MNTTDLVPVFPGELNGQPVQLVDARELWQFLSINTRFNDWIRQRIEEYGFEDGKDFCSIFSKSRGRPRAEYHVTLDTAKELAMVERNDKGRQARRYFIECERRLREVTHPPIPEALPKALQAAIDRKAHLLTLRSFDRIRGALAELARQHLQRGDSEAEVLKRIEQDSPLIGDMHLIQADDLWPLTNYVAELTAALAIIMEGPMGAVHRLEARTGRDWYHR